MKGKYPCNECGISKQWSLFCEENEPVKLGYEVLDPTFHEVEIDGVNVIRFYPLADKSYKTVMVVTINGPGLTQYVEKLK